MPHISVARPLPGAAGQRTVSVLAMSFRQNYKAYPIQRPEEENIEARPSTGTVPVTMAPVASM